MNSHLAALTWEIWRRGRRPVWLALLCLATCAAMNLGLWRDLHSSEAGRTLFGLSMALSVFLLMGVFNYTEFSTSREWNGFPYRLFTLPVRTVELVTLPVILGVVSVELVYLAWIKLVWTHGEITKPEWFAVVLGAYVVFYQTTLWCLAGFKIARILVLSIGGTSSIAVACLPFSTNLSAGMSEGCLVPILCGLTLIAFAIGWHTVARQRSGGGRRESWVKVLADQIIDAIPKRTRDFETPAAAQFWYEWRRAGWLLPAATAFTLLLIGAPLSWLYQSDAQFTLNALVELLVMPTILAFVIGKGFIRPDFWSGNLSAPSFLGVRPLPPGDFVVTKMKVAAAAVALAWLLVIAFVALWLSLWANTTQLSELWSEFRMICPHTCQLMTVLYLGVLITLTWRCLVNGLWSGLSGNQLLYAGPILLQILIPALALLSCGIWSDAIDSEIQNHPEVVKSTLIGAAGWTLALLVIAKIWVAAFSWRRISRRRSRQYLFIWMGATAVFIWLAILSAPPFDTYRTGRLFILVAILLVPFARVGLAPASWARNRAA